LRWPYCWSEIHQVDEDQAGIEGVHGLDGLDHAVSVVLGLHRFPDAAAQKHVEDFADAVDRHTALFETVEQHALGRPARRNRDGWRCA